MMVSVVIPFYNNISWLKDALDSVFEQTYTDYEVIIVDDGSKEDITSLLKDYDYKIIHKRIENSGPGIARNTGVSIATGTYIAFLDSDDLWYKNKLKQQVNFMQKNSSKWSHTSYETFFSESGIKIKDIDLGKFHGDLFKKFLLSCPIATPCVMVERTLLEENNFGFSPEMRFGQDYFLWINLASVQKIDVLDQVLTKVRIRGGNTSKKAYNQLYAKAKIAEFLNKEEGIVLRKKIPFYIRIIFSSANLGHKIISSVSEKNELLSRIIYLPIYLYTRFLKVLV